MTVAAGFLRAARALRVRYYWFTLEGCSHAPLSADLIAAALYSLDHGAVAGSTAFLHGRPSGYRAREVAL